MIDFEKKRKEKEKREKYKAEVGVFVNTVKDMLIGFEFSYKDTRKRSVR